MVYKARGVTIVTRLRCSEGGCLRLRRLGREQPAASERAKPRAAGGPEHRRRRLVTEDAASGRLFE